MTSLASKMSEGIAGVGTIHTALRVYAATHGGYPTINAADDWMAMVGLKPDDLKGKYLGPEDYTVSSTRAGYTVTVHVGNETYTIDQNSNETGTYKANH